MFQMQTIYQPDRPSPMLIAEIQYFMAFSAVQKMVAQEKNFDKGCKEDESPAGGAVWGTKI